MSALNYVIASGETALSAGVAKTLIAISAPANQRIKIKGVEIFGKGVTSTDTPVKVELVCAASIASGTPGTVTTIKNPTNMPETVQATVAGNYTAEPTYTTALSRVLECHPQSGFPYMFPMNDEIIVGGGSAFGVRLTSTQAETYSLNLVCEE
jgi:hypothetical protein